MHAAYLEVKTTMKESEAQFRKEMATARRINSALATVALTLRNRIQGRGNQPKAVR